MSSVVEVPVKPSPRSGSMARTRVRGVVAAVDDEGFDAVPRERCENGPDAILGGRPGKFGVGHGGVRDEASHAALMRNQGFKAW